MNSIVKYKLSGLWNSEYPLVVNRLINAVEKHNPHTINLGVSFDRLAAFRPQLEKIVAQERSDRESSMLSELDQQRDTFFNIIYTVAKTFQRSPIGSVSNSAHKIVTAFKKHGYNIAATNYTAETKRLFDIKADFDAQPDVLLALEELSLMPQYERMNEVNIDFDNLFEARKDRRAETERIDVRALRTECDKAIAMLWTAIEFCVAEYGAENYQPLINTINVRNTYYKQQLAQRATRRKAKQDVSKEDIIQEPEGLDVRV